MGEVLPSIELCDGLDNDCDGVVDEDGVCPQSLGASCIISSECASGSCTNGHCSPTAYRFIPGGSFLIGSPASEPGRSIGENQALRTVSSFFLKSTEVTQGEWTAAGYPNPSQFTGCGSTCPVEMVNWWEMLHFANNRSAADGLGSCYTLSGCDGTTIGSGKLCTGVTLQGGATLPVSCEGYRLPTHAEWEYGYRAGTTTAYYNGPITAPTGNDPNLNLIGWYTQNASSATKPVGGKDPNDWGLYDMAGNVWEYVWDWTSSSHATGVVPNYAGAATGSTRVFKGGSWGASAQYGRAATINTAILSARTNGLGFRLARTAPNVPNGATCEDDWQCASGFCAATKQCAPSGTTVPAGYRYIPGGTFTMGSPGDEAGRTTAENQESRTVSPFFMKTTEVTQGEWTAAGYPNPSNFTGCGTSCPVETVKWWEMLVFANNRSTAESLAECYVLSGCDPTPVGAGHFCTGVTLHGGAALPTSCEGYRLPTEAEWEYAYRAGTTTAFYRGGITAPFGNDPNLDPIGWYDGNAGSTTHVVGGKPANAWGLVDMSGNVYEWVWDWYASSNASGVPADYAGPESGTIRVFRGGSYNGAARAARAAHRNGAADGNTGASLGFRLARTAP